MSSEAGKIKIVADKVTKMLLKLGFIVQRYDAYSTNSVYLKLDYGVSNSIRISDHTGKKNLNYRFNLMTDVKEKRLDTKGPYPRAYYPINDIKGLMDDIQKHKSDKITKYGQAGYERFMRGNKADKSDTSGFWKQAIEVELNEQGEVVQKKETKNKKVNTKTTQRIVHQGAPVWQSLD